MDDEELSENQDQAISFKQEEKDPIRVEILHKSILIKKLSFMNSKWKMVQPQWARDLNQKGGNFNLQQFATNLSGEWDKMEYLNPRTRHANTS